MPGFPIATAVCASDKKLKLFLILKTLSKNGVEDENQSSHPAQNQRGFVSSVGGDSSFVQCLQGFGCQIYSSAKVRLIK